MGLFGILGKVAGSKIVEKVEDEFTKKENQKQTVKYCVYIKNNIDRIRKSITDLQNETQNIINEISSMKDVKLSFKEKGNFKKTKEKAYTNLQYLYLSRDFFAALSKNASGLELQNEELLLVAKFAPFFDGIPVLDLEDEEEDDSVLGMFKELGEEMMSIFVSSKKKTTHFDFIEYLYRYEGNLEEYLIPDVNSAIESFQNAITNQNDQFSTIVEPSKFVDSPIVCGEQVECPACYAKLDVNAKFCPECGNKIEISKPSFCTQCGEPIAANSKFCGNCGARI